MLDRESARTPLEVAHVLFMDLVGYSRLPLEDQDRWVGDLQGIVRSTPTFREGDLNGTVLSHPSGDGMALAFFHDPSMPLRCAIEITDGLRGQRDLPLRMGIHSGSVYRAEDINQTSNVRGPAINVAQRVMDCGDAGHILVSYSTADLLTKLREWETTLIDIGNFEIKHGETIRLYSFVDRDLGNADIPARQRGVPVAGPVAIAPPPLQHNLPEEVTTFVGREAEMHEVSEGLLTTRFITLTGTGGCGKTRLALRIASTIVDRYADGVCLVELAGLSDPGLVPQAVASALGVRDTSNQTVLVSLAAYLRDRAMLLVLDNCEHLIDACAGLVDALIRQCAGVHILATSREVLGVGGEVAWPVPSLRFPVDDDVSAEQLQGYEAARLFVDRATAASPSRLNVRRMTRTLPGNQLRISAISLDFFPREECQSI